MHETIKIHHLFHRRIKAHQQHAFHDDDGKLILRQWFFKSAILPHQYFVFDFIGVLFVGRRIVVIAGSIPGTGRAF
ncbi:MAG: hypothetical protein JRJ70_11870 [Deltaproteobacteria bacterium]|nr:hypothetical protein [Deltaproteobacteria bacterium]